MNEKILMAIAKEEQSPMYVFNLKELKKRVRFLREKLPKKVELCYAVKANPFILKALEDQLEYFEICSPGEYRICQRLEIAKKKYVISGVYKEKKETEKLIADGEEIGCYTAESIGQFQLLQEAANKYKKKIKVLLRLTCGNQFGIDREDLTRLVETYQNDPWLEIYGVQYFSGTQKNSIKKLTREIAMLDAYLEELYEEHHFKMPKLELGPGLPFNYFEGEDFDEEAFFRSFADLLSSMKYDGELTLELGRSLAASCGSYITRVVDVKQNQGENYAIIDGGMHQIVYYGHTMAMKRPKFSLLPSIRGGERKEWNICGSLCTTNDILVKRAPLSGLQIGDLLAFQNAGAYCMTEGISLFLSRDLPEIVLLNEDESYLVVRKPIEADLLNTPDMTADATSERMRLSPYAF